MTTMAAPRIDDRLRRFIAGSAHADTPAAITRSVGDLAWRLGLPRPSYEQVRKLVRTPAPVAVAPVQLTKLALRAAEKTLDFLYQYPAPGLEGWYRRYLRGDL
jgi:hypothetical protein